MARRRNVEGLENVRRVFARADDLAIEEITVALNAGVREIASMAQLLAPRDEGDLAGDIEARPPVVRADGKGVVADVVAGTTPANRIAAFRQEMARAPGPGDHPGHAAQPFMFPAYWAARKRVRNRVARAIRTAVKRLRSTGRG